MLSPGSHVEESLLLAEKRPSFFGRIRPEAEVRTRRDEGLLPLVKGGARFPQSPVRQLVVKGELSLA